MSQPEVRWQPVLLFVEGKPTRLECECGALATILCCNVHIPLPDEERGSDTYYALENSTAWCQYCLVQGQEDGEDEDGNEKKEKVTL